MRAGLMCPSRGNPFDAADDPSELQDAVLGLLEDAGLPTGINDQIMALVERGEREIAEAELKEAGRG